MLKQIANTSRRLINVVVIGFVAAAGAVVGGYVTANALEKFDKTVD